MSELEATGGGSAGRFGNVALAGVVSGVVFGLFIQVLLGRMAVIGGMFTFGDPNLAAGWVAHLVNSAVFALVFGAVTWWRPLANRLTTPGGAVGVGAGYGGVLWLVNIVFVWPLWLNALPSGAVPSLPVPYLASVQPLVGHLVWGAIMGGLFWWLDRR